MELTELRELGQKENPNREDIVVENGKAAIPRLTKEQEAEMFKALAHKSYKQVGLDFGFHFYYKTDAQVRAAVMNIVRKVRKAPEIYGISKDAVEVVDEAARSRSVKMNPKIRADIAIQNESFKDRLDTMRDKVAEMIMIKLQKYDSKRTIDGISIRDLKDLLATAIDKSRLMRGESTENIIKMSKIDTDAMSPDEALKVVMKAREAMIEARK